MESLLHPAAYLSNWRSEQIITSQIRYDGLGHWLHFEVMADIGSKRCHFASRTPNDVSLPDTAPRG